jgi:MoxR-like ATPase
MAQTTGLDQSLGMVVYAMNEKRRSIDMSGLLSKEAPTIRQQGSRLRTLEDARGVVEKIRARVRHDVMGRDDVIELALVALFSGGHVLLEDYPGSGKTTLAKALGESLIDDQPDDGIAAFRRIQFTPDLLPSDITGVMIFDTRSNRFQFRRGPIFAYVVLVDEINRTSPKVQAALLEAMGESQVTVDNVSHALDECFFVIATQNPLDAVGTYPLPVAQLDRFLFKIPMVHVTRDAELEVLNSWGAPREKTSLPRVFRGDVVQVRRILREQVAVAPRIHECLVDLARALRDDPRVAQGVSTRSLVQAIPALQALALIRGRDFIAPEDVEHLSNPLFHHRLSTTPGAESASTIIAEVRQGPLERLARSTISG